MQDTFHKQERRQGIRLCAAIRGCCSREAARQTQGARGQAACVQTGQSPAFGLHLDVAWRHGQRNLDIRDFAHVAGQQNLARPGAQRNPQRAAGIAPQHRGLGVHRDQRRPPVRTLAGQGQHHVDQRVYFQAQLHARTLRFNTKPRDIGTHRQTLRGRGEFLAQRVEQLSVGQARRSVQRGPGLPRRCDGSGRPSVAGGEHEAGDEHADQPRRGCARGHRRLWRLPQPGPTRQAEQQRPQRCKHQGQATQAQHHGSSRRQQHEVEALRGLHRALPDQAVCVPRPGWKAGTGLHLDAGVNLGEPARGARVQRGLRHFAFGLAQHVQRFASFPRLIRAHFLFGQGRVASRFPRGPRSRCGRHGEPRGTRRVRDLQPGIFQPRVQRKADLLDGVGNQPQRNHAGEQPRAPERSRQQLSGRQHARQRQQAEQDEPRRLGRIGHVPGQDQCTRDQRCRLGPEQFGAGQYAEQYKEEVPERPAGDPRAFGLVDATGVQQAPAGR